MTRVRIVEHTTTDDTYCDVENLDSGEIGVWLGDAESFKDEVAAPHGMTIEETWYS